MINAETFYAQRAVEMVDYVEAGGLYKRVNRTGRLEGQPVPMWAAALLHGLGDGGRATSDIEPVLVRVEGERWIVDCPFCPSAQVASETDLRFFCSDCLNDSVAGAYVRTEWPE